jgi:drug/metabolite transporter (DMT)-like permease
VRTEARIIPVLAVGLISISFAATLIRLTQAPALVIAAYRMGLSSLLLSPFFWRAWPKRRSELAADSTSLRLSVVSGAFLAFHFALWIESLNHTSVTSSVLLVTMNPIFLGVASPLLLKEKINRRMVIAIVLGISGAAVITLRGDRAGLLDLGHLQGNLLALGGAVMNSAYLLLGRRVRRNLSNISYSYVTYTVAALLLLLGVAVFRQPLHGYRVVTYVYFLLLAIAPQLVGHSSFNWALKHLTAPVVAVVILGEPVGASLIAWLILHQPPTALEVVGGLLVLAGIALAAARIGKSEFAPAE